MGSPGSAGRSAIRLVAIGGLVAASALVLGLVGGAVDTAAAQAAGGEGGLEGAIEGVIASQGSIGVVAVLVLGIALLTVSVEKLISYLARASIDANISLFSLAIVFTGFEFDDTVLAIVFSAGDLETVALGTALGTGLAIIGITLALASIVRPFPVDLPTDYVVIFAVSPLVLVPFVLTGTLTLVHGVVLVGFFLAAFLYVILRERQRAVPVFRNTELGAELREYWTDGGTPARPATLSEIPEDRWVGGTAVSGWLWLGLAVLALVGIVVAAMLLEGGSAAVLESTGIEGTVFGATFLTLILTVEDIMLTLEPVRRGLPEIGVGNVIGSVLFSVTGNVGVITFLGAVELSRSVLVLHLPAMIVVTAVAGYFFSRGEVTRWQGLVLGGLYVAYWVIALVVFSGVPIGE